MNSSISMLESTLRYASRYQFLLSFLRPNHFLFPMFFFIMTVGKNFVISRGIIFWNASAIKQGRLYYFSIESYWGALIGKIIPRRWRNSSYLLKLVYHDMMLILISRRALTKIYSALERVSFRVFLPQRMWILKMFPLFTLLALKGKVLRVNTFLQVFFA